MVDFGYTENLQLLHTISKFFGISFNCQQKPIQIKSVQPQKLRCLAPSTEIQLLEANPPLHPKSLNYRPTESNFPNELHLLKTQANVLEFQIQYSFPHSSWAHQICGAKDSLHF